MKEENPNYLHSQLITYIGNKRSLLPFIEEGVKIVKSELKKDNLSTFDGFAGSGIVSRFLKQHSSSVTVNDLEKYACLISQCYLSNVDEELTKKLTDLHKAVCEEVEKRLNDFLSKNEGIPGFVYELYAPKSEKNIKREERCFYTPRNAAFIDICRQVINEKVPLDLQHFFIAPLLSEVSIHANTAGIFKGFYKNSKTKTGQFGGNGSDALSRILGKIELPYPVFSNFECPFKVFNEDANRMNITKEGRMYLFDNDHVSTLLNDSTNKFIIRGEIKDNSAGNSKDFVEMMLNDYYPVSFKTPVEASSSAFGIQDDSLNYLLRKKDKTVYVKPVRISAKNIMLVETPSLRGALDDDSKYYMSKYEALDAVKKYDTFFSNPQNRLPAVSYSNRVLDSDYATMIYNNCEKYEAVYQENDKALVSITYDYSFNPSFVGYVWGNSQVTRNETATSTDGYTYNYLFWNRYAFSEYYSEPGSLYNYKDAIYETIERLDSGDYKSFYEINNKLTGICTDLINRVRQVKTVESGDQYSLTDENFENNIMDLVTKLKNPSRRIITGIKKLNELLSPALMSGRLYIFMGLPGGWKSGMLLKILRDCKRYNSDIQVKKPGKRPCALMITMENDVFETVERLFNMVVANDDIRNYTPKQVVNLIKENGELTVTDKNNMDIVIKYYANRSIDTSDLYTIIDDLSRKNLGCTLIATFGTEGTRSTILTACRGYRNEEYPDGIDVDTAQFLSSLIPQERGFLWPLADVINGNPDKDRKPITMFINEVQKYEGLLDINMSNRYKIKVLDEKYKNHTKIFIN